jgi:hypothetical protein
MGEVLEGLTPWEDVKETLQSPPESPYAKRSWDEMNDYVLNFVLSLLM